MKSGIKEKREYVEKRITRDALHCGISAIEVWASRWLSGEDRSAEAARGAMVEAAKLELGESEAAYDAAEEAEAFTELMGLLRDSFDFIEHLDAQREWFNATFGPGPRTAEVVAHIRKELNEVEADPNSLEEWCDVAVLAFNGAHRAGFSSEEIAVQLALKLDKNKKRKWNFDVPSGAPVEHVREDEEK